MRVTILGCGSSVGVPTIGCGCGVCLSHDPRNKRQRTCALLETDQGRRILIDTSSDLRQQALVNGLSRVSGVIYTHIHSDHTSGIDELRMFDAEDERENIIKLWSNRDTVEQLPQRFPALFSGDLNPQKGTKLQLFELKDHQYNDILDLKVFVFPQPHGNLMSNGLFFGSFAYCTDLSSLSEEALGVLSGVGVLFIECLGYVEKNSHLNFNAAVELIKRIKPRKAITIHMGHAIDYSELLQKFDGLFKGTGIDVIPAYDGLRIDL